MGTLTRMVRVYESSQNFTRRENNVVRATLMRCPAYRFTFSPKTTYPFPFTFIFRLDWPR
jgi:hypothetical protein